MSLGKINWSNFEGSHEKNGILMNVISFEINWDEWLSLSRYIYIYIQNAFVLLKLCLLGFNVSHSYIFMKSQKSLFSQRFEKNMQCANM